MTKKLEISVEAKLQTASAEQSAKKLNDALGRVGKQNLDPVSDGAVRKMDALLQQLQSEWEGAASESYAARYQEIKPGFMKAEELIREIAAALDSTAKIVEETDVNIANQFRG